MPRVTKEQKEVENVEEKVKKKATKESKTKATTKKTTTKKTSTTKKAVSKKPTSKKTVKSKNEKKVNIVEYYDLPYRYNQTIVKILAQTPNTLFIYWDISDYDRENFKKQYGDNFFDKTTPVLIIHK